MSWSLSADHVELTGPEAINKAAEAALADLRGKGPSYAGQFDTEETKAEVADQLGVAIAAAVVMVEGLGWPQVVNVNLYGHANPGHRPREGWAPESVTVTVTAVQSSEE